MEQVHLFISGNVQGVGFREFVKSAAKQHAVVGWINNLPDHRVEAVLQGTKEDIEKVILLCRKGPFLAEVRDVIEKKEIVTISYASFDITR